MTDPAGAQRVEEITQRYPSRSVTRRLSVQQPEHIVDDLHWLLDRLRAVEGERAKEKERADANFASYERVKGLYSTRR